MRWLKHMTATRDDEKVAMLIAKLGHEGYGLWWMVLETIAKSIGKGEDNSLRYPVNKWATELQLLPQHVFKKLQLVAEVGLLQVSRDGVVIEVRAPNLLKYRDEYSKKSGHTPDNIRPKQQKQKQIQITEAEAEAAASLAHDAKLLLEKHAPTTVRNNCGREIRNPIRVQVEEALSKARGRIQAASDPAAYEARIVTDELRRLGAM